MSEAINKKINEVAKTKTARKRLRKRVKALWAKWDKEYYSLKEQAKRHAQVKAENVRYVTQFERKAVSRRMLAGSVGMTPKALTNKSLTVKG